MLLNNRHCDISGAANARNDSNSNRDSSVTGRYSYLRSVGNAVVQEDVRKSVDRIRMSSENENQLKSKSELGVKQQHHHDEPCFEDTGRRGTAPICHDTGDDGRRQPKSGLNIYKPDMGAAMGVTSSFGANSRKSSKGEIFTPKVDPAN